MLPVANMENASCYVAFFLKVIQFLSSVLQTCLVSSISWEDGFLKLLNVLCDINAIMEVLK